jgi:hypothetical protein
LYLGKEWFKKFLKVEATNEANGAFGSSFFDGHCDGNHQLAKGGTDQSCRI